MNLLESIKLILSEALNDRQKLYVNQLEPNYNESNTHKELFDRYGASNRITLPLEKSKGIVDKEIRSHLAKNGWFVHNYISGLAGRYMPDRDGNKKLQLKSIGKILQQTGADKINHSELNDRLIKGNDGKPIKDTDGRFASEKVKQSLLHFYNNDPVRDSTKNEHNIVISRDRYDIGGMTSGRSWEANSCMRLPLTSSSDINCQDSGANNRKIGDDLRHHTLAVYAVKRGDDDIENPVSRVLIKKYTASDNSSSIYRPEPNPKHYGNPPHGFHEAVKKFSEENWPQKSDVEYKLEPSLYNDTGHNIIPSVGHPHNGLHHINIAGYSTTSHYCDGKLHDYMDEHGIKQPAVKQEGHGDIGYNHYKNGKLHNDNGKSVYIKTKNGAEYEEHHIDGMLHNLNGASKLLKLNGNPSARIYLNEYTKLEEHHVDGMLHRDNDLPASDIRDIRGNKSTKYSLYGLSHSNGSHPSILEENPREGIFSTQYHHYGELHSPDGIIPSSHEIDSDTDTKQWHQHGKIYRNGDLPSTIETKHGKYVRESWTNKLGEENTSDIPSTITKDYHTGNHINKIFNQNGNIIHTKYIPSSMTRYPNGDVNTYYSHPNGNYYLHENRANGDIKESWMHRDGMDTKTTKSNGDTILTIPNGRDENKLTILKNGSHILDNGYSKYMISKTGIIKDEYGDKHPDYLDDVKYVLDKSKSNENVGYHFNELYDMLKKKHGF